jgi:hypothetical protein
VVRNYDSQGGPVIPQLWEQTLANDASTRWKFEDWVPHTAHHSHYLVYFTFQHIVRVVRGFIVDSHILRARSTLNFIVPLFWTLTHSLPYSLAHCLTYSLALLRFTLSHCCRCQIPQVVVVFLGANDFSIPPQPSYARFSDGLNALLDRMETVNGPSVSIVVTCGPIENYCYEDTQQRVVVARGDPRVSFVSLLNSIPDVAYLGPFMGCNGHPNDEGAVFMAETLFPAVLKGIRK